MSIDGRWGRKHETEERLNAGNRTPNEGKQDDLSYLSPKDRKDIEKVKQILEGIPSDIDDVIVEPSFSAKDARAVVENTSLDELTAYDGKEVDKEYKTPESIKAIIEQLPEGVLDQVKELHSQKEIDDAIANCTPEEIDELLANPDEAAKNLEEKIFQMKLDKIQS